jgi:hypothetical protein
MKTGHVEKTNDRDYEVEERRYRTMEAASMRLQKEAKGYLDSLRGVWRVSEIGNLVTNLYSYDGLSDADRRDNRCVLR